MIGTSIWEYIFIRFCILSLRSVIPLSVFYCIVLFPAGYRIALALEIWAVAETLFLILYLYPMNVSLQRAAIHPEVVSREERRRLFQRCSDTIDDPEHYISLWHKGAPLSKIKRENVKEFFCWAFLNKGDYSPEEEEELEEYTRETELQLGRKLEPGRGTATPLRVTVDAVSTTYRSLFWYLCVFVVDLVTYFSLMFKGFQFHRLSLSRFLTVFPLRPFTLFNRQVTPAKTLTYWYRPHSSKNRLPVLFIHGIGIGLYPYVHFLNEINEPSGYDEDGEIGIIAIEIMPVSFRITRSALEKDTMCDEILQILQRHKWDRIVLVTHSYGSVISSHLIHSPKTSDRIGPVLLIDPVSILLHLPDVAYNFTCRPPIRANEFQLWFFASMDPGVAHTLGRCFFWSDNILWKDDLQGRLLTVSLSGRDLIVDTEAVGRYLCGEPDEASASPRWKDRAWKGKGIDVLWFDELDHAQVFDSQQDRKTLIAVIREYSVIGTVQPNAVQKKDD